MLSVEPSETPAERLLKTLNPKTGMLAKSLNKYTVNKLHNYSVYHSKPEQPQLDDAKQIDYVRMPSDDALLEARPQRPVSPCIQLTPSRANNSPNNSGPNTLNFSRRQLNSLPTTIGTRAQTLILLDISHNQLTVISPEFLTLTNLKILKLDHNCIQSIPDELFTSLPLEQLQISYNFLTSVPQSIGHAKNTLIYLNLSYNRIGMIPTELTKLIKLKSLWLNNNHFTAIPATFDSLESLKDFALEWFKYTNSPHAVYQTSRDKKAIMKLFALCQVFRGINSHEITFEDFVTLLSENTGDSVFNIKDSHGRNLLHIAALEEEVGIVQYTLQKRNYLINELEQEQQTPLSLAISGAKYFVAGMLLSYGADPNIGGGIYGSCLHIAVIRMQLDLVNELLKYGADPNAKDSEGKTPFHLLSEIFSKDIAVSEAIAEALIEGGCDPNSKNNLLWAPIHLMVRTGQIEGICWILQYNKACSDANKVIDVAAKGGPDEWTPLHLAANLGDIDIFNLLVVTDSAVTENTLSGRSLRSVCHDGIIMTKLVRKTESRWAKKHLIKAFESPAKSMDLSLNTNIHKFNRMTNKSPVKNLTMLQQRTPQKPEQSLATEANIEEIAANHIQELKVLSAPKQMRRDSVTRGSYLSHRSSISANWQILTQPLPRNDISTADSTIHERRLPQQCNEDQTTDRSITLDIDEKIRQDSKPQGALRIFPMYANNIQKIQITQSCRNRMFSRSGSFVASDMTLGLNEPIALASDLGSKTKDALPEELYGFIKKFENYDEIKKFQHYLVDEELALSEKLKFIVYLKAIHYKIRQQIRNYTCEQMPIELFIITEFLDDELRKRRHSSESSKRLSLNRHIVPKIFMDVLRSLHNGTHRINGNVLLRTEICYALGDIQYEEAKRALESILRDKRDGYLLKREACFALVKFEASSQAVSNRQSESIQSELMEEFTGGKPVSKSLMINLSDHRGSRMAELQKPINKPQEPENSRGASKNLTQLKGAARANQKNVSQDAGNYLMKKYVHEEIIRPDLSLIDVQDQIRKHYGDIGECGHESESVHQVPIERILVRGKFKRANLPVFNPQKRMPGV